MVRRLPTETSIQHEAGEYGREFFGKPCVPAAISVKPVASGSFNDIYLISVDGETVVLKCRKYQDPRGWASTEREAFALRHLRSTLRVPALRFYAPRTVRFPNGYIIYSWARGMPSVSSKAHAVALGRMIASLHTAHIVEHFPSDARHSRESVVRDAETLFQTLESMELTHPERLRIKGLLQLLALCRLEFGRFTSDEVCTHGDPVPSNFLYDRHSSSLTAIDWETFCLAPRTFDLWACMSSAFNTWDWAKGVTSRYRELFITSYSEATGLAIQPLFTSILRSAPLYALRHGLWCLYRAKVLDRNCILGGQNSMAERFLMISQRGFDEAERVEQLWQ
ncbi:aminoglycoside phosphotransferase family protein [Mesorhizobium sp. M8A.F.Ca.ET.208.01.1.1]|nr:aminoglycoside phosphotransferase family protein [Mesorhizobium sp. M8A.F.Ca.ET.208.01.1.1]TGT55457.1 aminoglycoside phosphotransferase family protein [Mesorhizobium sp. M8A.F.Ca.ET.167.01.1.1]